MLSDLDGTLLNSNKEISGENLRALYRLAEAGIEFVPASGRAYGGMPEQLRKLPFINWAVEVNGARVYDIKSGVLRRHAAIELPRALEMYDYLLSFGTYTDCFIDGQAWSQESYYVRIPEYAPGQALRQLYSGTRRTVPDLRAYIAGEGRAVEKFQMLFKTSAERKAAAEEIERRFPDIAVTNAIDTNLEMNARDATKGDALIWLCGELGIDISRAMAIGDGKNDLSMLKAAGFAVAMGNAFEELKESADFITADNDHSGFAAAVEKIL